MAASKSPDGGAAGGSWPGGRKWGESRPMAFSRLRHLARRFWNQTCNTGRTRSTQGEDLHIFIIGIRFEYRFDSQK